MFLSLSSDFYTSERRQRTVKLLDQLSKEASFLAVSNYVYALRNSNMLFQKMETVC